MECLAHIYVLDCKPEELNNMYFTFYAPLIWQTKLYSSALYIDLFSSMGTDYGSIFLSVFAL